MRNLLALIVGIVVCMLVNLALIQAGAALIPPPEGMDSNNLESIRANLDKLEPKHFLVPLFAHALGSLCGALIAAKFATKRKKLFALAVGLVHLAGGIAAAYMLPAPTWFLALDLLGAYLPMAWLGARLAGKERKA